MNTSFYNQIANSTAHRPIRDILSGQVLNNKSLFPDLLDIALTIKDKNHHKACWILELVCEAKIEWLTQYLDSFCSALPHFKHESAMRPLSKICLFAVEYQQKKTDFLSLPQLQQITETTFDWLIQPDTKVATKAYSMRTLFIIGKTEEWIYPELTRILSEDAAMHSAAYKAAAKDILRKINRLKK